MAITDKAQRNLFSEREMVASMIRVFAREMGIPPELLDRLDFRTMERAPTDFLDEELRERLADRVWKIRVRGAPDEAWPTGWVYVLIEFQAQPDSTMLPRMIEYLGGLHRLIAQVEPLESDDPRPRTLLMVVHHGRRRWNVMTETEDFRYYLLNLAACDLSRLPDDEPATWWARCERAENEQEVRTALAGAFRAIPGAKHERWRRAFYTRAKNLPIWEGLESFEEFEAEVMGGRFVEGMLDEKIEEWNRARHEAGRAEGRVEGRVEGRLEGLQQGLEAQRALLCQQASQRFGAETSGQLSAPLSRIDNFERLAEVGEWLIACETGEELLARFNGTR